MGILSEEYWRFKGKGHSKGGNENDIGEVRREPKCWHFWKPKQEFQGKVMVDSIKRLWRIHATEARKKMSTGFCN